MLSLRISRSISLILLVLTFKVFEGCKNNSTILLEVKSLPHYPSASGIEYHNHQFYVMGDDAPYLMILDSNLNLFDSIILYPFSEKRIPKAIKPDLEAMTLLPGKKLFVTGSGSHPNRNIAWSIDPVSKQKDSIRLDTFYRRLGWNGIAELNIEGLAAIPEGFVLCNRGSKGFPKNHLVFTHKNFWEQQSQVQFHTALTGTRNDSASFSGISGLAYAPQTDCLILTVSTEDTRNSMDDGAIGKSFLWIIHNISAKKNQKEITPDKIIDLDETDPRFKGQKVESVCVAGESRNKLYLVMAADNDNGSSTLFKLAVTKD